MKLRLNSNEPPSTEIVESKGKPVDLVFKQFKLLNSLICFVRYSVIGVWSFENVSERLANEQIYPKRLMQQ